jgi:hypothetical protein
VWHLPTEGVCFAAHLKAADEISSFLYNFFITPKHPNSNVRMGGALLRRRVYSTRESAFYVVE